MTPCFADTFYFLALLNPRDEAHARAVELSNRLVNPLTTTAWILTEVADALANSNARPLFGLFLDKFRADPRSTIVPVSPELFERAVLRYRERLDKAWSLTDCTSFLVMEEHAIRDALTADHHFEQAGFVALLK